MGLSFWEIAIILLVLLLVFGAKRIPEIAGALGRASREFKKAKDEIVTDVTDVTATPPANDAKTAATDAEVTAEPAEDKTKQA